jgi:mono/diheme cytochrome c family protein
MMACIVGSRLAVAARSALVLTVVSLASLACAQAQDAPKGDAGKGKALWLADGCSYCHGTVGQGGGGRSAGLRIAHQPLPFEAFLNQVRRPADEMPVYVESVLSNQDVADIFAYIRSLPPPPDLKSIRILN